MNATTVTALLLQLVIVLTLAMSEPSTPMSEPTSEPLTPTSEPSPPSPVYHDYCVIGAGPGGLQMGYFLQRAKRDYVIFEKSNISGSFFVSYPRHRTLISINKRYTGKTNKEFNLRHDWNSLISDDPSLVFKHYSKELFPHADDYVRYLNDYQRALSLNVQFETEVRDVRRAEDGTNFTMDDQHGTRYLCRSLLVATGLGVINTPKFKGIEYTEGYEDVSINPDDFEGQTVLILGRGNSAFETATNIYGVTNLIHMVARSRVRLSWATHYVGDLRAVNNALLDTYQLKSLDAVLEAPIEEVEIKKKDNKLYLSVTDADEDEELGIDFDNFAMREPYDRIIRCLGFKFDYDLFNKSLNMTFVKKKHRKLPKFPNIEYSYESSIAPGMFLVGTASHSVDFRKSAGGFIHGYRYTARALHRYLEWRYESIPWPSVMLPITDLLSTILKRINEASGPYQMFSILGDVFIIKSNGMEFVHIEEFPIKMLHKFTEMTGHEADRVIVWSLEYGANFSGPGNDIFRLDRATGEASQAHVSNFLHPVFYYYKHIPTQSVMNTRLYNEILPRPDRLHHIVEDFLTTWASPLSHILPLRRFLETCIGDDLRSFLANTCFKLTMMYKQLPIMCESGYLQGHGLFDHTSFFK